MTSSISDSAAHHQFLDLANRLGRIEALRAHIDAIHDGMATEQTVRIFQVVETFTRRFVEAVRNETTRLQQARRTDELVRVPPEAWAGGGAARAQDAFVQAVQLVALFRR